MLLYIKLWSLLPKNTEWLNGCTQKIPTKYQKLSGFREVATLIKLKIFASIWKTHYLCAKLRKNGLLAATPDGGA